MQTVCMARNRNRSENNVHLHNIQLLNLLSTFMLVYIIKWNLRFDQKIIRRIFQRVLNNVFHDAVQMRYRLGRLSCHWNLRFSIHKLWFILGVILVAQTIWLTYLVYSLILLNWDSTNMPAREHRWRLMLMNTQIFYGGDIYKKKPVAKIFIEKVTAYARLQVWVTVSEDIWPTREMSVTSIKAR